MSLDINILATASSAQERDNFKRSRLCAPELVSEAALECLLQSGW